ncbi:MAG: exo-alpha-sialidase, partial [Rikenellaceae bacterium]|nr:exo-alpha-sialidase [Rikenellaceae bacterium]
MRVKILQTALWAFLGVLPAAGQTGSPAEPVRYVGGEITDPDLHDGGLRYIVGVENIQVLRANRTDPGQAEDYGWTYNHAPNLTYWRGKFYLQYLSNPADEHVSPGQTLLVVSPDGREWGKPVVVFPPYEAPEGVDIPEGYNGYMMHQRMGFYTAPSGRLLTLAFYGHTDSPFKEGGIGRVVREIYPDGSFGPIYFIRYSSHTGWRESNTSYPFYTSSPDKGFVAACEALLADRLRTLQWYDEDRGIDGFHHMPNMPEHREAVSYFHRADGKVVGLWKKSYATLSDDDGLTWSADVKLPTLKMAGGKVWGQGTADGRYAIVYNPIATQEYRYPLAMVTSSDGILFDGLGVVHGEVPPRRFFGRWKDFGPCYVRGIVEGEQTPGDGNMWVAYSVNKEDIWVSRIPLPAVTAVEGDVADNFNDIEPGAPVPGWNLYSPKWAPVAVEAFPSAEDRSLGLRDEDPCDYAKAVRVFEETVRGGFSMDIYPHGYGRFDVELTDRHGSRAVRLVFDGQGRIGIDTG